MDGYTFDMYVDVLDALLYDQLQAVDLLAGAKGAQGSGLEPRNTITHCDLPWYLNPARSLKRVIRPCTSPIAHQSLSQYSRACHSLSFDILFCSFSRSLTNIGKGTSCSKVAASPGQTSAEHRTSSSPFIYGTSDLNLRQSSKLSHLRSLLTAKGN